jgi:hypothetical protein
MYGKTLDVAGAIPDSRHHVAGETVILANASGMEKRCSRPHRSQGAPVITPDRTKRCLIYGYSMAPSEGTDRPHAVWRGCGTGSEPDSGEFQECKSVHGDKSEGAKKFRGLRKQNSGADAVGTT